MRDFPFRDFPFAVLIEIALLSVGLWFFAIGVVALTFKFFAWAF